MHGNNQNRQNNFEDRTVKEEIAPVAEEISEESVTVDPEETAVAEPDTSVSDHPEEVSTEVSEKAKSLAVVTGCERLNVRETPDKDANVLTTIQAGSEVMIDMAASTTDFYKVCTAVGIEGFCMKQYITIR